MQFLYRPIDFSLSSSSKKIRGNLSALKISEVAAKGLKCLACILLGIFNVLNFQLFVFLLLVLSGVRVVGDRGLFFFNFHDRCMKVNFTLPCVSVNN